VRVLEPGGTYIPNSIGNSGGLFAGLLRMARASLIRKKSVTVGLVKVDVNRDNLAALAELLASREIRVVIDRAYPLRDAAKAVAHVLGHRARGKVALTVEGVAPVAGAMSWL
jgi:NADPH:quinone reductase-like Zn-dependent oxidoreductase